jgi:restriction endonuclease S subunit
MNENVDHLLEATLGDIFSERSRNRWKNRGKIGDFVEDFVKGVKRVKKEEIDENKKLRYITGSDIAEGTGVLVGNRTWNESNVKSAPYHFASGTVLYQMRDIDLRRATYVNFDGLHGEDIYPLRPLSTGTLLPRFLLCLLLTPHFTEYAMEKAEDENKGKGKRRPQLNKKLLLDYTIAFPDEDDQQRILRNLEAVLTKYNELQAVLAEEKTAIEQLEMSILELAFLKGKL